MKKLLRHWAASAVGTVAAIAFTSCAYDPAYTTVGGSYSSGYGDGYGYGGSNFSTSVFVGTGDPRWGYDPERYSYYDYHRRCYYDPYLDGYYPVGYRPPVVIGVPHPYGWRPGRGYCPPPRRVTNITVVNYRNREDAYRNSHHSCAKKVHQQPDHRGRNQGWNQDRRPDRYNDFKTKSGSRPSMNQGNHGNYGRPDTQSRPSNGSQIRRDQDRSRYSQQQKPGTRKNSNARPPSAYNTPVTHPSQRQIKPSQRNTRNENTSRRIQQPAYQGKKQQNPPSQHGGKPGRSEPKRSSKEEAKKVRSLGQG